ncbi:MAG: pilus assembly protein PilM [Candidatus Omnitrophica bacterium]|nr:pilus assembly protein PilM [Candidatus Omnitrophota bacterium]
MARTPRRGPARRGTAKAGPQKRSSRKRNAKKMGRGKRASTGIDIGTFSVKIVTLYGDEEGLVDVRRATVVPLAKPEGAEYSEELLDRQKNALKEAIKKHGKMEGKIILGFPRSKATIRYLNLPSANRTELREMLQYDVERHVPFPLDEIELSFQIVEQLGEHESRIMMVCAPRKELEPYMEICEELKIETARIDLDVLGDAEAYGRSIQEDETVAVCNFGRSSVKLSIIRNKQLLFSRSMPVSEDRLLSGFPGAKSWRDLQGRVTAAGALNPSEREHFSAWVDRLSMELLRSVSAYACENGAPKIDRMILSGGAGFFPAGPPRGLSVRIKTNASIEPALNGELPSGDGIHGCEISTCVGLALRGLRDEKNTLNLLPGEFIEDRRQIQKSAFHKNVFILFFMILILLGGAGYLYWYEKYLQLSQLDSFYSERAVQAAGLNKKKKEIGIVETYLNKEQSCLNVIQDVLKILPQKSYISSLTFSKSKTLEIMGQVETDDDYNQFLTALISLKIQGTEKPLFSNVRNETTLKQLNLGAVNKRVTDFRITCFLWRDEEKR